MNASLFFFFFFFAIGGIRADVWAAPRVEISTLLIILVATPQIERLLLATE